MHLKYSDVSPGRMPFSKIYISKKSRNERIKTDVIPIRDLCLRRCDYL